MSFFNKIYDITWQDDMKLQSVNGQSMVCFPAWTCEVVDITGDRQQVYFIEATYGVIKYL